MALPLHLALFLTGVSIILVMPVCQADISYAPDFQNIPGLTLSGISISASKQFASQRPGNPSNDHMCDRVTSVPQHLTFITKYNYYRKYTHAYSIPVVSSAYVSDAALKRACYVVRVLLADIEKVRYLMYKNFGRAGVIGSSEGVRSIPEHSWLPSWWDQRARGLGGTLQLPVSTGGEENLLCWTNDRYRNEDIFLHEFSHGIQEIAMESGAIPGFIQRLQAAYNSAKWEGLWVNTYAMSTWKEYFAEGVQSFFHVNDYAKPPNGIHNDINTRAKLQRYDPTLYGLIKEVFPCGNYIKDRCDKSDNLVSIRMNCNSNGGTTIQPKTTDSSKTTQKASPTSPNGRTTNAPKTTNSSKTTQKASPTSPNGGTTSPPKTTRTSMTTQKTSSQTTKTTKTTKTTLPDCRDQNNYCFSWAARGECSRNPGYMHAYCKKSCKICTGNGGSCMDLNTSCSSWAGRGECYRNPGYMLVYCKKSCSVC